MRTMPETAAITAHITSPSCAIWPLISCPRNPPRVPCVSKSNGPVGRTLTSQSSSPKSEMRLPWGRAGRPQRGDDILLSVITDGRHAALDMRLVIEGHGDEPGNKLNLLIDSVHDIWQRTADIAYAGPDGRASNRTGAGQMIFCDLGTQSAEKTRGFSAYGWIRDSLISRGVPAEQIAIMQDY